MGNNKGIRLGLKLIKAFKWFVPRRARRRTTVCRRLGHSRLCKWALSLRRGSSGLCSAKINPGYIQLGKEEVEQPKLPKGHLAVYVGDKEDDTCRVVVPVMYFNHPLFIELLREAEKVYGFNHPGGIQIPCPKSQLDRVQMNIAAATGGGIRRS